MPGCFTKETSWTNVISTQEGFFCWLSSRWTWLRHSTGLGRLCWKSQAGLAISQYNKPHQARSGIISHYWSFVSVFIIFTSFLRLVPGFFRAQSGSIAIFLAARESAWATALSMECTSVPQTRAIAFLCTTLQNEFIVAYHLLITPQCVEPTFSASKWNSLLLYHVFPFVGCQANKCHNLKCNKYGFPQLFLQVHIVAKMQCTLFLPINTAKVHQSYFLS